MKKNIIVIAAIASASFVTFNLSSASGNLAKIDSTIALEGWSEIKQTSDSQSAEEGAYTGNDEDGNKETVPTSS